MSNHPPVLPPCEPDTATLDRLAAFSRVSILLALVLGIFSLIARLIPPFGALIPSALHVMRPESSLDVLSTSLGIYFADPRRSRRHRWLSPSFAALVIVLSVAVMVDRYAHLAFRLEAFLPPAFYSPGSMAPLNAGAFILLAICIIFLRAQSKPAVWIGDLATFGAGFMVMALIAGYLVASSPLFGPTSHVPTSPQTLICLLLLVAVAILRRARKGVFAIFLGRGIGGRIARILAPLLIFLPFIREGLRAHIINAGRMPPHYITAYLGSFASVASISLLIFLAWRIDAMEGEIRELSLRDELTGLHNLRGFRLLADQALRLAQRSQLPFSVIFVDVDNLKEVNDALGHSAGSGFLVETGEILRAAFRETDVMGRVGGDEFAIAGQFDRESVAAAANRLHKFAHRRNTLAHSRFKLTFSVGYVTADEGRGETLDLLLASADQMMYNQKRTKKLVAR